MDYLQQMRLRRLGEFDPQPLSPWSVDTRGIFDQALKPPIGMGNSTPTTDRSPMDAPDSNLRALRQRARPYMDQYSTMLQSQPNREDHQLSKIGKALAAASGIITGTMQNPQQGMGVYKNLTDEPYNRAVTDYGTKGARLKELAGIEDTRLADEEKLEVAIAADEAKRRDDLRQWISTQSGIELNDARIKQIEQRMQTEGLSWGVNQITGQRELLDTKTGKIVPVGQILETPAQKDARVFNNFLKEFGVKQAGEKEMEGIRQAGRIQIKGMDQAHDKVMEGLRSSNDENQIRLRANLDKLSPTQQNAAFNGAYEQVLTMDPTLRDSLFETNPENGEVTLRKDYDPTLFNVFTTSVQELMNQKMGRASGFGDVTLPPNSPAASPTSPTGTAAPTNVSPQAANPLNTAAATWLKNNDYEVNDASIGNLIQQANSDPEIMKELMGAPANPTVALPPQVAPQVALPQGVNQPGMFRNFGQPSNPNITQSYNPPTFTDLIKNIRGIPGRIYGGGPGYDPRMTLR